MSLPVQRDRVTSGGRIDRDGTLTFIFDDRSYAGHPGDTLASALLANGVRLVGRSFKYHRPRGILTAGSEEPNALVELREAARREPNTKATTIELYDGLVAASQNRWPSLEFDLAAANQLLAPLFVAGFYYKTFKWPSTFWERVYEPAIRRAAGLGRASHLPDPDHYEHAFAFCDVLVIGAGPAGLVAALASGRTGARVALCEEDFDFGGRLLAETAEIDGLPSHLWVDRAVNELRCLPNVRLMPRTALFGVYDGHTFGAVEKVSDHLRVPSEHQPRQRLWHIICQRSIVATGAVERPMVFPGNDRPGVMTAGAVRAYLNRFAVVPGHSTAVFTNGDSGWQTAFDLAGLHNRNDVCVAAVIDTRNDVPAELEQRARRMGIRVVKAGRVTGTRGGKRLESIKIAGPSGHTEHLRADLLATSGGWNPLLSLSTHLGARPSWSSTIHAFVPDVIPEGMVVVGAARGTLTLGRTLIEAHDAGVEAAAACGFECGATSPPRAADEGFGLSPAWYFAGKGKAFVDFQHDVTSNDIALAYREGYRSVELLKRYTTLGMATDQGRTSNVNGQAIMAQLLQEPIQKVGTTVARPPCVPVAIGAMAGYATGQHFRPRRLTAAHGYFVEQGAHFVEAGLWMRAQWFARPGEGDWLQSVTREVRNVSEAVGVCDVSTLGKIELQGPDALTFVNRIYATDFLDLTVGSARYGIMLRDDGIVFDDGIVARFAEEHFVLSTTTANAGTVIQHLNFCADVLWPELDVQVVPVTDAWAQYVVAGPNSRELLKSLFCDTIDLSDEGLPPMAVTAVEWSDLPVRLFRISHSGELAYEVAIPANFGEAFARTLLDVGEKHGAMLYGTEALDVMRVEMGRIAAAEISGTTTASDLGFGQVLSSRRNFLGRTLAMREGLEEDDRMALVGFKPKKASERPRSGAHFLGLNAEPSTSNDQGYVTSVAFSPTLGRWIGLGLLKGGRARLGERMRAVDLLGDVDMEIEICLPKFITSERMTVRGW